MLNCGRIILKNLEPFPKFFTPVRHCNRTAKQSDLGVVIPKRVERGPTDILKALASTVQLDPTAFAYKYPDDPYFYPFSNHEKRIYALSMESGRKSARWIIENNPGFFKNQLSDPPIEDFLQKITYNENSEVTEESLIGAIERRKVQNAIVTFNLLQEKGVVISDKVKQSLLELVCFYNAEEKENVEELEYKWFANAEGDNLQINTWKEESFAETLFESMNPNCPLANSTMIQGMIKYNNVNKALEIFNKAKSNKVKLSVGVYNALLTQASNTTADITDGLTFIDQLLKEMSSEKVKPNVGTLNAALKSLMHLKKSENYVQKLLMEFAHLGISPSLGTYYYIFHIFGNTRGKFNKNRDLFIQLLKIIQNTKFDIMHSSDFLFFPLTMKLFSALAKDVELSYWLNNILFQNDNLKFIENSVSESMYFRDYMTLLFKKEPLEIAMEKYREIVPAVYSPEYDVIMVMLSAVTDNKHPEYFLEFWSDVKKFKMNKYMKILSKILPLAEVFTEEKVLKGIHEAAVCAVEYIESSELTRASQSTISNLLIALLKTGDDKRALQVFSKVKDFENASALLNADAIKELFRYALAAEKVPIIMECLRYADNESYLDVIEMAEMALPLLTENDRTWVSHLIEKLKEEKEPNEKEVGGET